MSLQDNSFKLLDFTIYDEKHEPDPISSSSDDDSSDNSRSGGYKTKEEKILRIMAKKLITKK